MLDLKMSRETVDSKTIIVSFTYTDNSKASLILSLKVTLAIESHKF